MFFRCLMVSMIFQACASVETKPDQIYRKTIEMEIDGKKFIGTAMVPRKNKYRITITPRAKSEKVTVTTCNGEEVFHSPGKSFTWNYQPIPELEDTGFCPVEIMALDNSGKHSWGYIGFIDPGVEAEISCNRKVWRQSGSSLCHAPVDLIQQIRFAVSVKVTSGDCQAPESQDQKKWQWEMEEKKCLFIFSTENGMKHKIRTLPYTSTFMEK